MGDHRISVDISVTGLNGEVAKIEWWLNWTDNMPSRLSAELVRKAEKIGLPVDFESSLAADIFLLHSK